MRRRSPVGFGRERKHKGNIVAPDDHRYFTIERDGEVLYDSRSDVRSTDDNPSAWR
jgi:hypothetical protein